MALLEVLKFPDPRLRRVSVDLEKVTPEVRQFAQDMLETMYYSHGIGLSAPQVNRLIRLIITNTLPKDKDDEEARYDFGHTDEARKSDRATPLSYQPHYKGAGGRDHLSRGLFEPPHLLRKGEAV